MFHIFVLTILIGSTLAGSIVQRSDNSQQTQQPQQQSQQSITGQNQINSPTYSPSQGNHQLQYQYPSYPEYSDSEYSIGSESEGHLFPVATSSLPKLSFTTGLAMSLIPLARSLMTYGTQVGTYLLHFLLALAVGGAFTTLICTFTPLCSISFMGLSLNQYGVREQVADLARTYITPESVNAATVLVTRAIDKYNAMQRERREKPKQARR